MPSIAIVDDKFDFRDTVKNAIAMRVPEGWTVVESEPLEHLSDYPAWISEGDIAVLLLDERLTDTANSAGAYSTYEGHDLLSFLRSRLADFPIYIITAQAIPQELKNAEGEADDLLDKGLFVKDIGKFVPRMIRRASRWFEVNSAALARFSLLSEKLACGQASGSEISELRAIQSSLTIADVAPSSRVNALTALEVAIRDLKECIERGRVNVVRS